MDRASVGKAGMGVLAVPVDRQLRAARRLVRLDRQGSVVPPAIRRGRCSRGRVRPVLRVNVRNALPMQVPRKDVLP